MCGFTGAGISAASGISTYRIPAIVGSLRITGHAQCLAKHPDKSQEILGGFFLPWKKPGRTQRTWLLPARRNGSSCGRHYPNVDNLHRKPEAGPSMNCMGTCSGFVA